MFSTLNKSFSHNKLIWKQTRNSSKIFNKNQSFLASQVFKFFLPSKTICFYSSKAITIYYLNDQVLHIMDFKNFEIFSLLLNWPRPRMWKTPNHSKFFNSKSMVISYNTPKSFIRTIQNILGRIAIFDNSQIGFLKAKATHFLF